MSWTAWPTGLAGHDLYLQFAIQDPAAVCGVALNDAVKAHVP